MKVTGPQNPTIQETTTGKTREKGEKPAQTERRESPSTDGVSNRTTLTMTRIKEAIRTEPEVRSERVAELKAKVAGGKYKVDPDSVAKNLLTESLRDDLEKP